MCNDIIMFGSIKRIFLCLLLFNLLKQIHSKSFKRSEECQKFLLINDCYYFPCLDSYFQCGPNSYLAKFSFDFCKLIKRKYFSQLNKNAQFYFEHTNICAMTSLNDHLIEQKISAQFTCTNLQAMVFDTYLNCFQNKQRANQMVTIIDFCSIVCENLQTIIDLFLNLNNDYINLHQLLIKTGQSCGAQIDEAIGHTIPSLIIAICLDRKNVRLKGDITKIMFNARFQQDDYDWID